MKTKTTFIILILVLQLSAQSTISGKVTDKKGIPIIGANVYLENTYDGATTDDLGKFSFESEVIGSQTLIISYLAFKTFRFNADVAALNNLNVVLKEEK